MQQCNIVYNLFNNSIYYNKIVRFVSIDIDDIMIDRDVDIDKTDFCKF